jgi:hypothetical protein
MNETTVFSNKFDVIFIGTSIICVLEAIHLSLSGKSVLMVDKQEQMGGAWVALDIFDLHDVENAIHYLLPDEYAFDFMKNELEWRVVHSPKKYRVFPFPVIKYIKFPYDSRLGRFISLISENEKPKTKVSHIFRAFNDAFIKYRQPSYYIEGGTNEMINKVKKRLLSSSVNVQFNTAITNIHIDNNKLVEVMAGKQKIQANKIYITHGSRINKISGNKGSVILKDKLHLRPALHLLVDDIAPSEIFECVFSTDNLIKYAHDITRFVRESDSISGKQKVIVLALRHKVENSIDVRTEIFNKLKDVGMLGSDSKMINSYWQDVYLPRLYDSDLEKIKGEFGEQVEILKTENFSKGIGYHVEKWSLELKDDKHLPNI